MKPIKHFLTLTLCFLSGCASIAIQTTGIQLEASLCQSIAPQSSLSILWAPHWRTDQKEPALRETAALSGIQRYFSSQSCIQRLTVQRIALPEKYNDLTEAQLLSMTKSESEPPDQVILIIIRELGPLLRIGLPTLIEGGTEVVLEIQAIDMDSAFSPVNVKTHWQHVGPFYIKGVDTLDLDMEAALSTVFSKQSL